MKLILLLIGVFFSSISYAGIEVDKDAGECGAFLMASKKINGAKGADLAVSMADKENRAINFGLDWIEKLKRYSNDEKALVSIIYKADSACRRIGIRPSDYQ